MVDCSTETTCVSLDPGSPTLSFTTQTTVGPDTAPDPSATQSEIAPDSLTAYPSYPYPFADPNFTSPEPSATSYPTSLDTNSFSTPAPETSPTLSASDDPNTIIPITTQDPDFGQPNGIPSRTRTRTRTRTRSLTTTITPSASDTALLSSFSPTASSLFSSTSISSQPPSSTSISSTSSGLTSTTNTSSPSSSTTTSSSPSSSSPNYSSPSSASPSNSSSPIPGNRSTSNTGLIVGLSVGITFFFIFLVAGGLALHHHVRNRRNNQSNLRGTSRGAAAGATETSLLGRTGRRERDSSSIDFGSMARESTSADDFGAGGEGKEGRRESSGVAERRRSRTAERRPLMESYDGGQGMREISNESGRSVSFADLDHGRGGARGGRAGVEDGAEGVGGGWDRRPLMGYRYGNHDIRDSGPPFATYFPREWVQSQIYEAGNGTATELGESTAIGSGSSGSLGIGTKPGSAATIAALDGSSKVDRTSAVEVNETGGVQKESSETSLPPRPPSLVNASVDSHWRALSTSRTSTNPTLRDRPLPQAASSSETNQEIRPDGRHERGRRSVDSSRSGTHRPMRNSGSETGSIFQEDVWPPPGEQSRLLDPLMNSAKVDLTEIEGDVMGASSSTNSTEDSSGTGVTPRRFSSETSLRGGGASSRRAAPPSSFPANFNTNANGSRSSLTDAIARNDLADASIGFDANTDRDIPIPFINRKLHTGTPLPSTESSTPSPSTPLATARTDVPSRPALGFLPPGAARPKPPAVSSVLYDEGLNDDVGLPLLNYSYSNQHAEPSSASGSQAGSWRPGRWRARLSNSFG